MDIISELIKSGGLLQAGLYGVRSMWESLLGIKNVQIMSDDRIKEELENRIKSGVEKNSIYPYSYLQMSDARVIKDRNNQTAIQRYGYRTGTATATKASTNVGHIFPIEMGMQFTYVHGDVLSYLRMAEAMLILSALKTISFDLKVGEMVLNSRVEIPDTETLNLASVNDTADPGGFKLEVQFRYTTWAGVFRAAEAVQTDKADMSVEIKNITVGGEV